MPEAPQDLVMTLLGAHLRPRDRQAWSGGLVELLGGFGISEGAARVALTRLVRRELLAKVKDGRLVHYTVTPRSAAVFEEGDTRIFQLGREVPETPQWTVLWHAIPEEEKVARTRLVRRLRFLGFGPVQDGTWIAPHDREREVASLLKEQGVERHAGLLLGSPAGSLDFSSFVSRVWDLDDLAARYRAFVDEFSGCDPADLTGRAALLLRTRLAHQFRQFPFLDPELPACLVPPPAHRAQAVRLFHDLYTALAPAAMRHFDEVMQP
ncbi:PaaX family transcriptional regulator C-terminal domain-containing protein [Kibdelosporangium persicum]|uniref:Phenylacetic acid degradation operon negative regulatory protein paaX n=1 Tax=Kibdelosporangium persicum TaxID=2698649 RepID=A0ABX2EVF1_9PSEU|nr:PaaX family transcriptional regulator C-terminal domain-containing protein [Kibdelosporangium persicum]NRN63010.1 Phenylacetic acid degradation operon negative regulatory protein paaX [Kibdelosporangium persicum]